ncbi:MAG: 3-carboxy-cis,cis-muconate cycloisomerase [Minwuiales bacterium]|nr:3-carboxy-cis,cis-muconate cycloisomerase [Minwuiales bacterium]
MASTPIESDIFRDLFGTEAMRRVFADDALVGHYLAIEAALARVQGRLGIIPAEAAAAIEAGARPDAIDMAALKAGTDRVGYPILPLVKQLAAACPGDLGQYCHWGATTQDIMDTALALQLREALALVDTDLAALSGALADLARRYRDTPVAARTHLQHALPTTFGYKAAVWLSSIERHRRRLAELKPRVLVGQFSGAAGTLASLSHDGLAVQDALMDELGLGRPDITWHVARDGLAEAVGFLGLVTGSLAKIATDVMLMMQTEVGEAFEPFAEGRGASSTMPQKRNPISCELILAAAANVRQQVAAMFGAMAHDHDRATGPWHVEWLAVPQAFILTAGATGQALGMLRGLEVDTDRMRENLDMTGGLIVAEAVMMALAPHIGRQHAHDLVYDACRSAAAGERPFLDILADTPEIARHLDRTRLSTLVDPANYVGQAGEMVDRLLSKLINKDSGK